MLWAQGLLHLLLLFYLQDGSQTSFAESIRRKLRCFQVHPQTYTWTRFQAQNAVYMKTTVDWRHFSTVEHYRQPSTFMYIGSTSQSVFRRESNRMSVAKKLTSGREAQAELSIRFWVSNKSLQTYTLFLVTPCSTYKEAWVTEHCLIGMWQPKLNHPYIISFLQRSALGLRPNKRVRLSAFSKFGLRLWRKLRKKLHNQNQPEIFQLKRRSAWEILFNLTCFSRAPFEELKRLRSDRYVPDEIYSFNSSQQFFGRTWQNQSQESPQVSAHVPEYVLASLGVGVAAEIHRTSQLWHGDFKVDPESSAPVQAHPDPLPFAGV